MKTAAANRFPTVGEPFSDRFQTVLSSGGGSGAPFKAPRCSPRYPAVYLPPLFPPLCPALTPLSANPPITPAFPPRFACPLPPPPHHLAGPYPLLPLPRPEKTFSLVPVLTERNCQGFVFSAIYRNQMKFIADGPSGDRSNRRRFEVGGSTAALKAAAAAVGPPPFCNTA